MKRSRILPAAFACIALLSTGCSAEGDQEAQERKAAEAERRTPVTVAAAVAKPVEEKETSVGRIEAVAAPMVNAEVSGRIARLHADEGDRVDSGAVLVELDTTDFKLALTAAKAEVQRLDALLANQRNTVARYRKLRLEDTVSADVLDAAESQLKALREQLAAAHTERQLAEHNLNKTRIRAPVSGHVESREVSVGDFVAPGTPLYRLADPTRLRVVLPFPEAASGRIRPGLTVRLRAAHSDQVLETQVDAVRPMVTRQGNALYAVSYIENPGGWKPGASVEASLILERREQAVVVPAVSVVRRPSGTVVYVVKDGKAVERAVTTGVRLDGAIEIHKGLRSDERLAVDGAGFLSDGAAVEVREDLS